MSWSIATAHPLGECLSKEKSLFFRRSLCLCGGKCGFIDNGHVTVTSPRRSGLSREATRGIPKGGAKAARCKDARAAKAMRCTFALPRFAAEAAPTGVAL